MKLALRYIPTEVWVDVICYPWISRRKLGKIVDRFRNRYFAEILQYCLHERGKQTLTEMYLDETLLDIPQTPMPENIKFFEKITIMHFDSSALDFLRSISTLFLNDVNLNLQFFESEKELSSLRTVLDHLAPLFHGIYSLQFDQAAIPLVQQYFGPKLAQVKMIKIYLEPFDPASIQAVNFCLNWLTSGEQDPAEPKFLEVKYCLEFEQFSLSVQKQFQSGKSPSTFVIKFIDYGKIDFQLDLGNNIGEQLHGQFDEDGNFWIFRHPLDSTRTQLEGWVKEMVEKRDKSNGFTIDYKLTIGLIAGNAGDNNEVNDGHVHVEEEAGPSTSGKSNKLT